MAVKASYVRLEKALLPDFRVELQNSNTNMEIMNCFSKTTETIVELAMDREMMLMDDDIILQPMEQCKFKFSNRLMKNQMFNEMMANSDMPNILERFALAAEHRYRHKVRTGKAVRMRKQEKMMM